MRVSSSAGMWGASNEISIIRTAPAWRPAEIDTLITESAHVLRWLSALSTTSVPAQRAWVSLSRLLQLALAKLGKEPGVLTLYMATDTSLPPLTTPTAAIFHTQESEFLSDQSLGPWPTGDAL